MFVVGVADVDFSELQNIGSKPSERHIFVVDDFDAFGTIKDNLITFICETATSCEWAWPGCSIIIIAYLSICLYIVDPLFIFYSVSPDLPQWIHFTW